MQGHARGQSAGAPQESTMTLIASCVLFTVLSQAPDALSGPVYQQMVAAAGTETTPMRTVAPRIEISPSADRPGRLASPPTAWRLRQPRRPSGLTAMYASYGALQVLDAYSTRRALGGGAHEVNPLMIPAASNTAALVAVKSATTAVSIYFAERAWKKNRKGTVALMLVLNGVTAAITVHNLQQRQ
jgi:Domain of unknown function (DUF5658)